MAEILAWTLYLIGCWAVIAGYNPANGISLPKTVGLALLWPLGALVLVAARLFARSGRHG